MRWKIIVFNAVIVVIMGVLTYALLATSLSDVVQNPTQRKTEVAQSLRAASAQLALDALRLERWMAEKANTAPVREVFSGGTPEARSEAATVQANKLRDAAVAEPSFAKMAPALVLFVDRTGVAMGRNGSALMRGDKMGEAYPSLAKSLESGNTASDVWLNRERQEQLLASYAPVRGENGEVVGALVVGTPLNDDRLSRTSEMTSGHFLALSVAGKQLETVASSGGAGAGVVEAAGTDTVKQASQAALSTANVAAAEGVNAGYVFAAAPLAGYGDDKRAVILAAVPASLVGSLSGLLWPVFGVSALGILLVMVTGYLLGNYFSRPVSELEDGLLAVINGRTDLRFQIEHPDLGGLVFRINSLLNQLMGVPEDTTDEEGRPSIPTQGGPSFEDLSVQDGGGSTPADAAHALHVEDANSYYQRLFSEYINAKRQLGEPVDHITQAAFIGHIRQNEQQAIAQSGRPVRYRVEVRGNAITLVAVPQP
ncbi:MAG: MXAN_5187 C-terminal domain-containing protein [Polyangiaceae bacterium]